MQNFTDKTDDLKAVVEHEYRRRIQKARQSNLEPDGVRSTVLWADNQYEITRLLLQLSRELATETKMTEGINHV